MNVLVVQVVIEVSFPMVSIDAVRVPEHIGPLLRFCDGFCQCHLNVLSSSAIVINYKSMSRLSNLFC